MDKRIELRRAADVANHTPPCPILQDYMQVSEQIHIDLQLIKQTLTETKEMLEAFRNAKGFIRTVQILGEIAKWCIAIGTVVTAIYWWGKR